MKILLILASVLGGGNDFTIYFRYNKHLKEDLYWAAMLKHDKPNVRVIPIATGTESLAYSIGRYNKWIKLPAHTIPYKTFWPKFAHYQERLWNYELEHTRWKLHKSTYYNEQYAKDLMNASMCLVPKLKASDMYHEVIFGQKGTLVLKVYKYPFYQVSRVEIHKWESVGFIPTPARAEKQLPEPVPKYDPLDYLLIHK